MYSQSAFWTSLLFRQCQSVSALQYRMDEKLTRHLKGNTDKCCHQSIPWFDPIALLSGSTNICQRSCRERELLCILDVYPFSFQILESLRRCELYQTEKTSQMPNSNKDMLLFKSRHKRTDPAQKTNATRCDNDRLFITLLSGNPGLGNWLYAEASFVLSSRICHLKRARWKRDEQIRWYSVR